jgi:hypothetical protein
MRQENMNEAERKAVLELIEAAKPFLDGNIVDETCGTIPLMNRLEAAIDAIEEKAM